MKYKKQIFYLILVFISILGSWLIPSLVKKATHSPDNYPFVYYSSMMKELGLVDYKNKQFPLADLRGKRYSTAQFDSLMPLLNYRQLMVDGRLPDSIDGKEITPQIVRSKAVTYRYTPELMQTPRMGLHILFETMPKRVGLEMPDDVFRMKDRIEFIDAETNRINAAKSELFQKALDKAEYRFPPQWLSGNPNPRKAYDEGYFSLDANGDLYHIKMVNGRPYVRNTNVAGEIKPAWFSMLEVSDKRFYGFLFDNKGDIYIIEGNDGKYAPLKLDIPPIDLTRDQLTIMGNLLYWTVSVTTPEGRRYYGLETETLKQVAAYSVERSQTMWDKVAKYVFPYYITFEQEHNDFLIPCVHYTAWYGFGLNALLAVTGFFLLGNRKRSRLAAGYVLLTGVAGFIALWILPDFKINE
ncbi:MAG: DUF4857 domain-containing protein [Mediterranea sp.]|jgi:hypothetical protein|nr:DUF4857 domain-containing protein [Mediterranea sp.]